MNKRTNFTRFHLPTALNKRRKSPYSFMHSSYILPGQIQRKVYKWQGRGEDDGANKNNVSVSLRLIALLQSDSLSLWDKARNCCAHKLAPVSEYQSCLLAPESSYLRVEGCSRCTEYSAFDWTPEAPEPCGLQCSNTRRQACQSHN